MGMTNTNHVAPGDTVNVILYGEVEPVIVIRVAPKMIQVRYPTFATVVPSDIRTEVYTLRASGQWILKGKNHEYAPRLDIVGCGM